MSDINFHGDVNVQGDQNVAGQDGAESPGCTGRRPRARTRLSHVRRLRVGQRAGARPAERDCSANAAPVAPAGASPRGRPAAVSAGSGASWRSGSGAAPW